MKTLILAIVLALIVLDSVQGHTYGYRKKSKKSTKLPVVKDKFVDKKDPIFLPDDIPLCNVPCNRRFISPECRQDTFGFENGVRCTGCPVDVCRNTWSGVGQGHLGGLDGGLGLDRWENGGFGGSDFNSWVNGDVWQNRGAFSGSLGDNGFLGGNSWQDRAGLGGRFEDPLVDSFQSGFRNQRLENRFDAADRLVQNRW